MTILDRNSGTFNTTTSVTVTRSTGSFGTNTVLVVAIFGNTVFNTPGTMTQRTASVVDLGLYSYDKTGAGETSLPFTATSAGSGVWFCWELSAGSTFLSPGSATQNNSGALTFTTGTLTPTLGNRHLLVAAGGVGSGNVRSVTGFSNSFVTGSAQASVQVSAQDWPFAAGADRDVVADGVTGYSTTATFSGIAQTASGAVFLSYADGGSAPAADPRRPARRGPNYRR